MLNIFRSSAAAIGIIVGIIICVFIFKFANKDRKVRTEYDERQKLIKGRGYMYGFYTTMIYEAIIMVLLIGDIDLPIKQYVWHALGIYLGVVVVCVHAIWNRAYWGLNNDHKKYMGVFVACFILNLFPVIGTLRSGINIVDGYLDLPFVNLICLVFFLILSVAAIAREVLDAGEKEDDDI